jgi:hypothetical protein
MKRRAFPLRHSPFQIGSSSAHLPDEVIDVLRTIGIHFAVGGVSQLVGDGGLCPHKEVLWLPLPGPLPAPSRFPLTYASGTALASRRALEAPT